VVVELEKKVSEPNQLHAVWFEFEMK